MILADTIGTEFHMLHQYRQVFSEDSTFSQFRWAWFRASMDNFIFLQIGSQTGTTRSNRRKLQTEATLKILFGVHNK